MLEALAWEFGLEEALILREGVGVGAREGVVVVVEQPEGFLLHHLAVEPTDGWYVELEMDAHTAQFLIVLLVHILIAAGVSQQWVDAVGHYLMQHSLHIIRWSEVARFNQQMIIRQGQLLSPWEGEEVVEHILSSQMEFDVASAFFPDDIECVVIYLLKALGCVRHILHDMGGKPNLLNPLLLHEVKKVNCHSVFLYTIIHTWQQVAMVISVALKQSTVRNLY